MIVSLFILLPIETKVWAIDETKLVSSAEKVVEAWGKVLSKEVDLVSYTSSGYWRVRRHKLIDGTLSYDIKKTDSIVSPYMLIVGFKTFFMDNDSSPNAKGYYDQNLKKWYGFKTAEEALTNTNPIDFAPDITGRRGLDLDLKVHYAYQKVIWVLKGGNRLFGFNFSEHLYSKENGHYFKDLLSIPIE
jgi:hypothetical protein